MTVSRYHLVSRGRVLDGFSPEAVADTLCRRFNIGRPAAARLIGSPGVTIKKNLDRDSAQRLGEALKRAGLDVGLIAAPAPAIAPAGDGPAPALPWKAEAPSPAIPPPPEPVPPARPTEAIAFVFSGSGSEYFRIWIVNIVLSILTMGIYSAWAKVRRKQYFYGNTRLERSSFAYLADPMKILKGRAIVAGVFFAYSMVSEMAPLIGLLLGLAAIALLPWLAVRSLTFNARNSAFRNIRFDFTGTVRQAAAVYVLWPLLSTLTLGVLAPYTIYRQKRFGVENSRYGTTRFDFTATPRDYHRIFLGALPAAIIGIGAASAAVFVFPPALIPLLMVLYLYLMAFFSVRLTNLMFNASRLADHRLSAGLEIKAYAGIVLVNTLATALTLGLYHPWAKVRTVRYRLAHLTLLPGSGLDGFVAAEQRQVSALGDEASDFLDFDIGL